MDPVHPTLLVLGTIQDAGSPQVGCRKDCCKDLWQYPDPARKVVSLGLIDPSDHKKYLFEASPDMVSQLMYLNEFYPTSNTLPDGIFLTHAHIGHYTGLMYLGKEAINAQKIPVHAMPKMLEFLSHNGPWSQLVTNENILLTAIKNELIIELTDQLKITPILVPHRDEFSETVGYRIAGPMKSALFIPDIDKWSKWDHNIVEEIKKVDYAFLDATFYDGAELNNRDMSEIPHPFIAESIALFEQLPMEQKNKVHFIHFNHTNPVLNSSSEAYKNLISQGFHISKMGDRFTL